MKNLIVNPFLLFAISIFILLVAPISIQDGMFMDGTLYASVAKNLAHGQGSFWFQTFSQTEMIHYHEQLPLFVGLESIFFMLLGDSIYTEFIFTLVLGFCTILFIHKIWKIITPEDNDGKYSWLAILLWSITPVVFWSYANNVQETLMVLFATGSVYFTLKSIHLEKKIWLNITLAGIFIFLCSFCKGFQGLFPLVAIAFYWLVFRKISFKKALLYSLYLIGLVTGMYMILLLNESSYKSIEAYFHDRILRTFSNDYSAYTPNRFYLLWMLFQELLPALIITLITYFIGRLGKVNIKMNTNKQTIFFLLLALSGSLPLMVTMEQRGFYLCTTIPFYIFSLVYLIYPIVKNWFGNKKKSYVLKNVSIIIFFVAIVVSIFFIGGTARDKDKLHDIYKIGDLLGEKQIIAVDKEVGEEYSTMAYFSRYFFISIDRSDKQGNYYLVKKGTQVYKDYERVEGDFQYFDLYEK